MHRAAGYPRGHGAVFSRRHPLHRSLPYSRIIFRTAPPRSTHSRSSCSAFRAASPPGAPARPARSFPYTSSCTYRSPSSGSLPGTGGGAFPPPGPLSRKQEKRRCSGCPAPGRGPVSLPYQPASPCPRSPVTFARSQRAPSSPATHPLSGVLYLHTWLQAPPLILAPHRGQKTARTSRPAVCFLSRFVFAMCPPKTVTFARCAARNAAAANQNMFC